MRNRAKCKICKEIIESFHRHDYVTCSCGEISIDGGQDQYGASSRNWDNFLRVDDEGNEIIPKVIDKEPETIEVTDEPKPPSRQDKIDMLKSMADNIERLPQNAMTLPITHYDHLSLILLIHSILESNDQ